MRLHRNANLFEERMSIHMTLDGDSPFKCLNTKKRIERIKGLIFDLRICEISRSQLKSRRYRILINQMDYYVDEFHVATHFFMKLTLLPARSQAKFLIAKMSSALLIVKNFKE